MEKEWYKDGKFTELTKEQVAELEDAQVVEYYADKTSEAVKGIENATKEQLKELNEKLDNLAKATKLDELEANHKGLVEVVNQIVANKVSVDPKLDDVEKAISDKKENLKNLKTGEAVDFVIKATANTGDISNNTYSERLPGIGQLPNPALMMTDVIHTTPASANTITYLDWDDATVVRAAKSIAEGTQYPESTVGWIERPISLHKIADIIPITDELTTDYPALVAEIKRFIQTNVSRKLNSELYSGTNVAPHLDGLWTQVVAFNSAGYSGTTFTDANLLDLLDVLATQIRNGSADKFTPQTVFISHNDYLKLANHKNANGDYIFKDMLKLLPYTFVRSSYVTDNTLVFGDITKAEIKQRGGIKVSVGYNGEDFGHGRKSIRGEVRAQLLIRKSNLGGFLKVTDIDDAITAITA